MTKNKLESKFSESFHAFPQTYWGMKLQVNLLAHTNSPGDFLINFKHTEKADLPSGHYEGNTYLICNIIECKQVTCEPGENGRLAYKRLRQMHDMLSFEAFSKHQKAYFLIGFLESRWADSEVYMIPVNDMHYHIEHSTKVSMTREEAKNFFRYFRVLYTNGLLEFWQLKKVDP